MSRDNFRIGWVRDRDEGPLPGQDDRGICYVDNIGMLDGVVLHGRPSGCVFRVVAMPERRPRIEARLTWLRDAGERGDKRTAACIISVHREVQIRLGGDRASEALNADLSMTAAALVRDARPQVGATVTVGKRYATVVRHMPEGVGVAFRLPFGPSTLNGQVIL